MRALDDKVSFPANHRRPPAEDFGWQQAMTFWRRFPAEAFDADGRDLVRVCVRSIFATMEPWRRGIDGDPAAAVALALSFEIPKSIGIKADLAMTVLLRCAFENAAAALVLSNRLAVMPLDRTDRARLSTSWLGHNLWLAHRRTDARCLFPKPRSIDGERK